MRATLSSNFGEQLCSDYQTTFASNFQTTFDYGATIERLSSNFAGDRQRTTPARKRKPAPLGGFK